MSKTTLKKELQNYSADQLRELILELYTARPEVKSYFEFYLNPDVDKLFEKEYAKIIKELNRSKWGYSKARISTIKKIIKNFESYSPGFAAVGKMYLTTLARLVALERILNYPKPLLSGMCFLLTSYVQLYDKNNMLDEAIDNLDHVLNKSDYGTHNVKSMLRVTLNNYLESQKI